MKTIVLLMALLLTGAAFAQNKFDLKPEMSRAVAGATMLKGMMRNPDSLVIDRVLYSNNGKDKDAYCYEWRSQNGFGGMNRSIAFYDVKHKSDGSEKAGRIILPEDGTPFFQAKARQQGCNDMGKNEQNITDQFKAVMPPK